MEITSFSQLDPQLKYTYADYLLWQFQDRVELIKGYIRQMTAPSVRHQRMAGVLEYWVVYPSEQVLQRYILDASGIYQAQRPDVQGDFPGISFLPDFQLNVEEIFEE